MAASARRRCSASWPTAGVPLLGVCLGAQLLAEATGGEARRAAEPEIGWREVTLEPAAADDPLLGALPERFDSFQWHSYEALPPAGATLLARSAVCAQAYRLDGPSRSGASSSTPRSRSRRPRAGSTDYRTDPDAAGIDPAAFAAGDPAERSPSGTRSARRSASVSSRWRRRPPGLMRAGRG